MYPHFELNYIKKNFIFGKKQEEKWQYKIIDDTEMDNSFFFIFFKFFVNFRYSSQIESLILDAINL